MALEKEIRIEERIKAFSFPLLIATLGFFGVATYNKLTLIGETLIEIKFKVVEQDSRIKQDELIFNYLRADVDELKAIINKTSADKEYHALVVH